jgi:hypothetical protein
MGLRIAEPLVRILKRRRGLRLGPASSCRRRRVRVLFPFHPLPQLAQACHWTHGLALSVATRKRRSRAQVRRHRPRSHQINPSPLLDSSPLLIRHFFFCDAAFLCSCSARIYPAAPRFQPPPPLLIGSFSLRCCSVSWDARRARYSAFRAGGRKTRIGVRRANSGRSLLLFSGKLHRFLSPVLGGPCVVSCLFQSSRYFYCACT